MTDIEQKALAQAVQAAGRRMQDYNIMAEENVLRQSIEAHARAIERHETDIADLQAEYDEVCKLFEAFRQEVSDAVEAVFAGYHDAPIPWVVMRRKLEPFIIAKPDPLVEVIRTALREGSPFNEDGSHDYTAEAKVIAAAIEARGGRIVWGEKQ